VALEQSCGNAWAVLAGLARRRTPAGLLRGVRRRPSPVRRIDDGCGWGRTGDLSRVRCTAWVPRQPTPQRRTAPEDQQLRWQGRRHRARHPACRRQRRGHRADHLHGLRRGSVWHRGASLRGHLAGLPTLRWPVHGTQRLGRGSKACAARATSSTPRSGRTSGQFASSGSFARRAGEPRRGGSASS
jgi:hypothetical protein